MTERVEKTDAEWQAELDPDRYQVLRCGATEAPWSGELNLVHDEGMFKCGACGTELFRSDTKFDSGSGWPSFFAPLDEEAVETEEDLTHGMRRTEVRCATCGSHLGHVFPDGPAADRSALLHQFARAGLRADRRLTKRQQDLEAGALVDLLQPQVAAVPHDDPLGDVEAEARSFARLLRREERVEDALGDLRRNALAVVLDLDAEKVARAATFGSSRGRSLERRRRRCR